MERVHPTMTSLRLLPCGVSLAMPFWVMDILLAILLCQAPNRLRVTPPVLRVVLRPSFVFWLCSTISCPLIWGGSSRCLLVSCLRWVLIIYLFAMFSVMPSALVGMILHWCSAGSPVLLGFPESPESPAYPEFPEFPVSPVYPVYPVYPESPAYPLESSQMS